MIPWEEFSAINIKIVSIVRKGDRCQKYTEQDLIISSADLYSRSISNKEARNRKKES